MAATADDFKKSLLSIISSHHYQPRRSKLSIRGASSGGASQWRGGHQVAAHECLEQTSSRALSSESSSSFFS